MSNIFQEGEYIVQLFPTQSNALLQNHIYKQDFSSKVLYTTKDSNGQQTSSGYVFYSKPETWRYATAEEIAEYGRLGKPYDVTTLKKHNPMNVKYGIGAYVVCVGSKHSQAAKVDSAGWVENLCLKVTRVNIVPNNPDVLWFEKHGMGVYEDCVRPATAEEIKEYFKKGDPYDVTTLKKEENLVGRYLKALVNEAQGIALCKKGDYFKITDSPNKIMDGAGKLWNASFPDCPYFAKHWELMPEGFVPAESTEAVAAPKTEYKVGDWIVFNDLNGSLGDKKFKLGKAYQILSLSAPFMAPGDCNALFEEGLRARLSSFGNGSEKHKYQEKFRRAYPYEIPSSFASQPSQVELMAEAKRRYPVGTKYRGVGGEIFTVEKQTFEFTRPNVIIGEFMKGVLYREGVWATVIKTIPVEPDTGLKTTTVFERVPVYPSIKDLPPIVLHYTSSVVNPLQHQEPVLLKSNSKKVQLISVNTNN